MSDKYASWSELIAENEAGTDFVVRLEPRRGTLWLIAAPHGGGIEPGTTEIARAIADSDFSFYSVEGLKRRGNAALHITSRRFNEPTFEESVIDHPRVLAVHGSERRSDVMVWVGGGDTELVARAVQDLSKGGYEAAVDWFTPGTEPGNLCNRGSSGRGLQLELSRALRSQFFSDLTRAGRRITKPALARFAAVVRRLIEAA
jgi:phage replication-related protein YjqB (UPF0714/DUF867 family)